MDNLQKTDKTLQDFNCYLKRQITPKFLSKLIIFTILDSQNQYNQQPMKMSLNIAQSAKLSIYTFLAFLLWGQPSFGQDGIKYNSEEAFNGYTLCTAENIGNTYLLDNCGEIVNVWNGNFPRHYSRLTNEGNLVYINSNRIIEKNWDGVTVKSVLPNTSNLFLDYEVMKLSNGNYLCVARRLVNQSAFAAIGWAPGIPIPDRLDGIVEIAPNGDIVWEWNIADHTIQDKIASAPNYGIVKDHPELLDVNAISDYDWEYGESFMINGMDYNADLDQIVISVRKMSEIMIIDHSTTTAEAQGSTGGLSGKGGDILYRWGNPQNYGQGSESDRILYYQHNPNWVKYGEHKDKIIMYNNGLNRDPTGQNRFSSVHIVNTPVNPDGSYPLENNKAFEPSDADLTFDKETSGHDFYSGYTSGAQVLPNGNIYITVGAPSDFIELTPDGTLAWDYTLDFSYSIFRTEKYAKDFPGFEGRDLTGNGTVETPSSSYNCSLYTSTKEIENQTSISLFYDPYHSILQIKDLESTNNMLVLKNLQGQVIRSIRDIANNAQISLDNVAMGMYVATIYNLDNNRKSSHKFIKY